MVDKRKIFGVGVHRTGTTSLMRALQSLGYRTSHWTDRDEVRADIERGKFRISLMERVDALSDFPVPNIYRQLAVGFPEGRFILTIRAPEHWLASVERHTDGRVLEDEVRMFYGRATFDRSTFLARFAAHNREVVDYFGSRENFIVMDIPSGDGWEKLCPFLGEDAPPPGTRFPGAARSRPGPFRRE